MDKIVDKLVGLGLPGLLLLILVGTSSFTGAAAVTSSLAFLGGPLGMLGGVAVLGLLAMISNSVAKYGFENILRRVIIGMKQKGHTEAEVISYISRLPVSRELKNKLITTVAVAFRGL